MNWTSRTFLLLLLATAALPLRAQTGCVDSPEDPTIALALIGSAGVIFTTLRNRRKARRSQCSKLAE